MNIILGKTLGSYKLNYGQKYAPLDVSKGDGLPYLRDKLFISIVLFSTPVYILLYIPAIILTLQEKMFALALVDTLCIITFLLIFFIRNQKIRSKKIAFSAVNYFLAVYLAVILGFQGAGFYIIFCISVLITLYHGEKAGYISVALNAALFLLLIAMLPINFSQLSFFVEYSVASWIVVCLTLIAFNFVVVMSVSFLLDHLNESIISEKQLQVLLIEESKDLIEAKVRAEESDRLKSAFLANMSHEIRTPMNGILGFAELLKEPELTGEEQQKYIAVIEKSGERMLNIIKDIIDISKIEAGQVTVELKDTNINDLSEFVFNFFAPEIKKKGLTFTCNIPKSENHLIIKTDREKLYAILTNLVKNAIKYTPNGSIEFGYETVETLHATSLRFYVKDTGIGIPKDRQKAIFDRFVQADIEDTKAFQGAGLGLAISTAYAKMLGGNIRVESEPEKGSTFYLNLPLPQSSDNISAGNINNEIGKQSAPLNKGLTILIAEDEPSSALFLTKMLQTESKQILHAKNGEEAVEACRKNPGIALVLMDIKMPRMNGYEAARMIRTFNKNVIIIAQTAYALSGDRDKALEAGCNDYISKPIKVNELRNILAKYLGRKQQNIDEIPAGNHGLSLANTFDTSKTSTN